MMEANELDMMNRAEPVMWSGSDGTTDALEKWTFSRCLLVRVVRDYC